MHLATTIVNDQPITCVVTERGVAPVAQLDPTLPADPVELQSDTVWPALVAAVEAADHDLFVPVETVTFAPT
ncbi:MAG TPA: hypothetical protein VIT65_27560 [Microlunatus sp.]